MQLSKLTKNSGIAQILIIITTTIVLIVAKPLQEFTWFIWWMQTKLRGGRQPQTKPTNFDCESARKKWQLLSASTIAIYYYWARELLLVLSSHGGWKAELTWALQ